MLYLNQAKKKKKHVTFTFIINSYAQRKQNQFCKPQTHFEEIPLMAECHGLCIRSQISLKHCDFLCEGNFWLFLCNDQTPSFEQTGDASSVTYSSQKMDWVTKQVTQFHFSCHVGLSRYTGLLHSSGNRCYHTWREGRAEGFRSVSLLNRTNPATSDLGSRNACYVRASVGGGYAPLSCCAAAAEDRLYI